MKRFILTSLSILVLLASSFAQQSTYFGVESCVANDIFQIQDNGDYLKSIPLYNAMASVSIRQQLTPLLFIETGVIMKYYQEGFGFKTIAYNPISSDDASWLIPARLGLRVTIMRDKLFFVPIIGYTFGIYPPAGDGYGYGNARTATTTIQYEYSNAPDTFRYFSLLQSGMGIEFRFADAFVMSLFGNYYRGFNKVTQMNILYKVDNASPMTGTASSNGDFWCAGIGLKYEISKLWQARLTD